MENTKTYVCYPDECAKPCFCTVLGAVLDPTYCLYGTPITTNWKLIGTNLVKATDPSELGEKYTADDVIKAAGLREDIPDEPAHEDDYERVFIPRRH